MRSKYFTGLNYLFSWEIHEIENSNNNVIKVNNYETPGWGVRKEAMQRDTEYMFRWYNKSLQFKHYG